ncbi:MAG: DivIVA domain-containing protein [Clostridia bacterium]|nr:DivIVA domain-containing protein [Clostridia bacterium]
MTPKPMTPESLSPRAFSETKSGYSPAEVDAYIAELTASYTLLYRENEKLAAELEMAKEKSETIIEEAYLKADDILASVQNGCDSILRNFRDKVEAQKKAMEDMQASLLCFKNELFEKYRLHIELIERIAPVYDENEWLTPDDCMERIAEELRRDIEAQYGVLLETEILLKKEEEKPARTRYAQTSDRASKKSQRPMGKAPAQKQLSVMELLDKYDDQNTLRKGKNSCEEQFSLNFDGGNLE